jgi:hypothetical protein
MYKEIEYNNKYLLLFIKVFTYKFNSNSYFIRYKVYFYNKGDL